MRALTAGMLAAIAAGTVRPVMLYEGEFSAGTVRLWTGLGDLTWAGFIWTGAGNMLAVSSIEETNELRAVSFSVSLSGALSSIVSLALAQCRTGLPGTVLLGAIDSAGLLIADPFASFKGRLDVPDITDDGSQTRISITYESRLIDLDRVRERRYTPEDQKIDYPTDNGFDFVPSLQDSTIKWGRG